MIESYMEKQTITKSDTEDFNLVFNLKVIVKMLLRGRQENTEILEKTTWENEEITDLF